VYWVKPVLFDTEPDNHKVGKGNTQEIERKNLNFRTWIKQLARKTICFSKLECHINTRCSTIIIRGIENSFLV